MESASLPNLGMSELQNRNTHLLGEIPFVGPGSSTSYGTETFLRGSVNVDFDIGLDFDGQLLQFY